MPQAMTYRTDENERRNIFRAYLVGPCIHPADPAATADDLKELAELVSTLEVPVVGQVVAGLKAPNPKYYVGSGKAEEIRDAAREAGANIVIFDVALSPTQQRNLEQLFELKVIDRQEVILDIFASRARTREAVLQVELARCQYFLPRLTGAWTHLSRQRGGVTGARGGGEKQIEYDRRELRQRISDLKSELEEVRKHRGTQRKSRMRANLPNAAIAGYTNAGKSTLLNLLTGAGAYAADQLFATLDPTTRALTLPDKTQLILTDTVGFIRRLPHSLIEAFRSTLEEAVLADFIVLVLDASNPNVFSHVETTLSVLGELGAERKSILVVCNKCDLIRDPLTRIKLKNSFPDAVFISCKTHEGIDTLLEALSEKCGGPSEICRAAIPPERSDLVALLHQKARILESSYRDDGMFVATVSVSGRESARFSPYLTPDEPRINQTFNI